MRDIASGPGSSRAATDRRLVRRARSGEAAAYRELVAPRLVGAYRLARAILGSDEAAADATTTAFAAAWRELPRLDDPDRFDDWLDRILLSECRMRIGAGPGATRSDPGAPVPADLLARLTGELGGTPVVGTETREGPSPAAAPGQGGSSATETGMGGAAAAEAGMLGAGDADGGPGGGRAFDESGPRGAAPGGARGSAAAATSRWRRSPARPRSRGPVLAAGAILAVVAIVVSMLMVGPWRSPSGTDGRGTGTAAGASGSAPGASGGGPASASGATPGTTLPATGDGLETDTIAMVTLQGDNLRVRTQPGTGDASKRLKPVLPAGTRLLVVGGPVSADGFQWYEIQTDGELIDLFGWVAAGDGSQAWLAPANLHCPEAPTPAAIVSLTRIDFLACFGSATVKVTTRADRLLAPGPDPAECGWARKGRTCASSNRWLLFPTGRAPIAAVGGVSQDVPVAVPPDLARAMAGVADRSTVLVTIGLDAPESTACRVKDATSGADVVPPDRAITACRLVFVVDEVAFRDPDGPEPSAGTN